MNKVKFSLMLVACMHVCGSLYSQQWKVYADSAVLYAGQKNNEKATWFYKKAKNELQKDSSQTITYISICDSLGVQYFIQRNYDSAEIIFKNNRTLVQELSGKENANYARACNILGKIYENTAQFEKAEVSYSEAKEIREKVFGTESADFAQSCNGLGNLYTKEGKYNLAEPLLAKALQIRKLLFGENNSDYAATCHNLGYLYCLNGDYAKSEPLLIKAKTIREKIFGRSNADYAQTCNNLGILYMNLSKYNLAEQLYSEAKQIRESLFGTNSILYASSCNNLAIIYMDEGKYKTAESFYLKALDIKVYLNGENNTDFAQGCNNLGVLFMQMGEYEKAEIYYQQAKQKIEKLEGNKHPDYATCCNNLGDLYRQMGLYKRAEPLFLEALEIRKNIGEKTNDYAFTCNDLAALYADMNEYDKAEQLVFKAKQIREEVLGTNNPDYANSCNSLAEIYMHRGDYDNAKKLLVEAKEIRAKVPGKMHTDYATNCTNLSALLLKTANYNQAELFGLESESILNKIVGKDHLFYAESSENLGNVYWLKNQLSKSNYYYVTALQSQKNIAHNIFSFTSEEEQQQFVNRNTGLAEHYLSLNLTSKILLSKGTTYNVSLSNRNIILSSSQQLRQSIYSSTDTAIQYKYNKWIDNRQQLSFWYAKPIAERPDYVKDLEEQANSLEKELTRSSSEFKNQQSKENTTWQAIQQNLKPNEAAIEFVDFNFFNGKRYTDSTYYIALLLRKDKPQPQLIKLFEKKQLDSLLNNANDINALYQNTFLYKITWKPIEKYLSGITKVYFALSGNLFKISFAALPVNNEKVLSDKYQLVQLNTTASVTDKKESFIATSDKLQLYGGIQYTADTTALKLATVAYHADNNVVMRSLPDDLERGGSIQYLPGTEKEVDDIKGEAIKTNTNVSVLSGINATEESFKALNGKNSPSVLHIATHGFFFPDPKQTDSIQRRFETSAKVFRQSDNPFFRSGLLFAGANNAWQGKSISGIEDGIVTAYDVSNMYLPDTKLVVLSACETALGDIQGSEGVYGLQRSFKIAGVQNLVMSLWKVPDAETAEFMQLFYNNMFAHQSVSDAFYHAQTTMKNKYRSEPVKWAAWVLVK